MVSLTGNSHWICWKLCNHHTPRYKRGEAWCDHNCRNVHNCRNTNHDCRKKTQWSQLQPQLSQTLINHNCRNTNHKCRNCLFSYQFCIKFWHSIQFSTILASLLTIRLWKLWNTVTYHKSMSQLSQFRDWNCDSCKILESLQWSMEKLRHLQLHNFLIMQLMN